MRIAFLDNDSKFGQLCTLIGTLIAANLLFVLTLLPVITAGAGLCALSYTMLKLVRYKEVNPFTDFWEGLKTNWKQATFGWMLALAVGAFFSADLWICSRSLETLRLCVPVISAAAFFCVILALYLFPVIAAFEGRLRDALRNSLFFAGKNMAYALVIMAVSLLPMLATYLFMDMLPLSAFLWCLCGFSLTSFCNALLLTRLFAPYQPEIEEEPPAENRHPSRWEILAEMRKIER